MQATHKVALPSQFSRVRLIGTRGLVTSQLQLDVTREYCHSLLLAFLLWPPCVTDADILFYRCGFFFVLLSSFFFPRPFSAVAEWMVYDTSAHDVTAKQ